MSIRLPPLVIVADDDPDVLRAMQHYLGEWDFRTIGVSDRHQLFLQLEREAPAVLLLDLHLGQTDGIEVLTEVRQKYPGLSVVMLTGKGSIDSAVIAIKRGAYDYLTKPPDLPRMRLVLQHASERQGLNARIRRLEQTLDDPGSVGRLWGNSLAMRRVTALVGIVAPTDVNVLVLGETGTGKELIARALHEQGPRRKGPFVPVNMAALPHELAESTLFGHEKGAFTGAVQSRAGCCEAAAGGTLFLDEIGEMDLSLQAKLLRFLQERTITRVGAHTPCPVDVRVIAATNRDLLHQIRQGQFREDLYFRLNVLPILLPPLRERREDIPLLGARFLQRFACKYEKPVRGFTSQAMELLIRFDWPGNIRQMENLIERLVILSSDAKIAVEEFPVDFQAAAQGAVSSAMASTTPTSDATVSAPPAQETAEKGLRRIDEIEKRAICDALQQTAGNVRATARLLGISPATVYRKFKQYNISPERMVGRDEASAGASS